MGKPVRQAVGEVLLVASIYEFYAEHAVQGRIGNTGQACTAAERFIVVEEA